MALASSSKTSVSINGLLLFMSALDIGTLPTLADAYSFGRVFRMRKQKPVTDVNLPTLRRLEGGPNLRANKEVPHLLQVNEEEDKDEMVAADTTSSMYIYDSSMPYGYEYSMPYDYQYSMPYDYDYSMPYDYDYSMPSDYDFSMPTDFDYSMPADYDYSMPADYDYSMPADYDYSMPYDNDYSMYYNYEQSML
jgi:hypothetical protein